MALDGANRNTWALSVFDRATGALVTRFDNLRFPTDYTDLTRIGIYMSDWNTTDPNTFYVDNFRVTYIPEPATMALLAGALLALAHRRRKQ